MAFKYEQGQFICHIYKTISADEKQILEDVIQIIQAEQKVTYQNHHIQSALADWIPVCDEHDEISLHVTLVRGHRAIYYHQLKSLVGALKSECESLRPLTICLDKLKIYSNFEKTKQFLSMSNCLSLGEDLYNFSKVKQTIQDIVDQYAIKLTDEDETPETSAHCSFMTREFKNDLKEHDVGSSSQKIEDLCYHHLGEYPMCLVRLNAIQIKIGNHVYDLEFKG